MILVLVTYVLTHFLNMHAKVSIGTRDISFGLNRYLRFASCVKAVNVLVRLPVYTGSSELRCTYMAMA